MILKKPDDHSLFTNIRLIQVLLFLLLQQSYNQKDAHRQSTIGPVSFLLIVNMNYF